MTPSIGFSGAGGISSGGSVVSALFAGSALVVASDAPSEIIRAAERNKRFFGDKLGICDGIADDVEIQAACDALTSGGRCQLIGFTFTLADQVTNTNDNVTVHGEGMHITTLDKSATAMDGKWALRHGVTGGAVNGCATRHLKVLGRFNKSSAFESQDTALGGTGNDLEISYCEVEGVGAEAVRSQTSGTRIWFHHNYIHDCAHNAFNHNAGPTDAIVWCTDNLAEDLGANGWEGAVGQYIISRNIFKNMDNWGINTNGTVSTTDVSAGVRVTDNEIHNPTGNSSSSGGILIIRGISDALVAGNYVEGGTGAGIFVSNDDASGAATAATRIAVRNNTVVDAGSGGSRACIIANADDTEITDNTVVFVANATIGIHITGGTGSIVAGNNAIGSFSTAAYNRSSSSVAHFKDNYVDGVLTQLDEEFWATYTYHLTDIGSSESFTTVPPVGGAAWQYLMPFNGRIHAISAHLNTALTGASSPSNNTITIQFAINGTHSTAIQASLSESGNSLHASDTGNGLKISAGDRLECTVSSGSEVAPANPDVDVLFHVAHTWARRNAV